MIKCLRKNWLLLLVFGVVFAILMIDLNPDYTFMNKALDSVEFIFCAKYFFVAHQMSVPLYLILGHVFLWIPFGTEAWRMGLISVLSTMGACVFIYLILLKQKKSSALLGVLIYGLSALVISQSTIVQTYSLISMLAIGAYYFVINKKWLWMAIMLGLGLAVHPLMGIIFIIFWIFFRSYRRNWKLLLITLSFGLFYLYIPLMSDKLLRLNGSSGVGSAILNLISVVVYFAGTISVWDLPKRIFDTIGVVGVSIGIITVIPLVSYFLKKDFYKDILFWLCFVPIIIFVSELDMQTYDYMMLAMPFLAIAICLGLSKLKWKYSQIAVCVVVIGLGIFNANYFDLGRTLDKNMNTARLYNSFSAMSDNAIYIGSKIPTGTNLNLVDKYNKDNNKNIRAIEIGRLSDLSYQRELTNEGIQFTVSDSPNEIAKSIVLLNDNVWISVLIDPSTYGFKAIEANHDVNLIPQDSVIENKIAWHWVPSNPYDIITSRLYLTEWQSAILSPYNFRLLLLAIIVILGVKFSFKKQKVKDVA